MESTLKIGNLHECKFCGLKLSSLNDYNSHEFNCRAETSHSNIVTTITIKEEINSNNETIDEMNDTSIKAKRAKLKTKETEHISEDERVAETKTSQKIKLEAPIVKEEPIDDYNDENNDSSMNPMADTLNSSGLSKEQSLLNLFDIKSEPTNAAEDKTLALQCIIVHKMHKGRTVSEICKQYNLKAEEVNEIWDKRDSIFAISRTDRKISRLMNKQVEINLLEWFNQQKESGIAITGKMLLDVADNFATDAGFLTFNGDLKWLERFKKKYNVLLRSTPAKREPYSGEFGAKFKDTFFKDSWPELRDGFADEDIFCADEFGVFFNSSRGRIIRTGGKKYIHGYPDDRFALFLCTNMTGSEKEKLIVCGTQDPLCRSSRNTDTLPVTYIRNRNAHFTTDIFENLVKEWDRQLEKDKRRALLILDRSSIHTKLKTLNLKLVFIPWKASTVLMPIKNGISAAFMTEYRNLTLLNKAHNVMRGIDRKLTCLEGLHMVYKAWERVPPSVIKDAFVQTGFEPINEYLKLDVTETPSHSDEEMNSIVDWIKDFDVEPHFKDLAKLEMYLTVEDELLTDQGTNKSVFGGNRKARQESNDRPQSDTEVLPVGTERPDNPDDEKNLLKTRALQDLDILKRFFESNDTNYETFIALNEVENHILRNPLRDDGGN